MFEAIAKNKIKTAAIVVCVFIFLSVVVYFIMYSTGYGEYAVSAAIIFSITASFFSYYFSDKMVLSISGARPADEQTDRTVKNALEGLCIASGLPMPKIYIINDPSPNAFATGRNPKNAVICVTTGLLETMDYYQLEGVLAHELAHIKNYDILLQTIVSIMVGIVVMLANIWTRSLWFGSGSRKSSKNNDSGGAAQLVIMVIGLIFIILAPIAGQIMKLALSRNREYLADATAIEFTRNPEGLATALEKLGASSIPMQRVNDATSPLYISSPISAATQKKVSNLFSTHPPIEKRVEAIRNLR